MTLQSLDACNNCRSVDYCSVMILKNWHLKKRRIDIKNVNKLVFVAMLLCVNLTKSAELSKFGVTKVGCTNFKDNYCV